MTQTRAGAAAVAATGALVLAAFAVGAVLNQREVAVHADAAPLFASWDPRAGLRSLPALVVGALVVAGGPWVARRARWPFALATACLAGTAWTACLALVDGTAGLLDPIAAPTEYPADVRRVQGVRELLQTFVASIPADSLQPWATHVSAHPPGALLVFVVLDRLGGSGPWPAALMCVVASGLATVAVGVGCDAVCGQEWARRVLPFAAVLPAAVWAGVSFDAVIAAVGAGGIALLAVAVRAGQVVAAVAAGVLLGTACLLSYGAVMLGPPALAVVLLVPGRRRWIVAGTAAAAALAVLVAVAAVGFDWWGALQAVRGRYLAGFGGSRPYGYWVWANFAVLAIAAGPAVWAGAGRLALRWGRPAGLVCGVLAAVLLATVSGMSKAEVERIWLPWTLWLAVAAGALGPRPRWWLAAQVVTGLALQHLLATPW